MTPEETHELTGAILTAIEARASESDTLLRTAAKWETVKKIASVVLFFGSMFAGGVLMLQEFRMKPTLFEVDARIEKKVEPIREKADKVDAVADTVGEIKTDLERVEKVQDYSLEQSAWQGDVLIHVAERKKTPPPPKPESLKRKERELLRQ